MKDFNYSPSDISKNKIFLLDIEKKLRMSPFPISIWKCIIAIFVIPGFWLVSEGKVSFEKVCFYEGCLADNHEWIFVTLLGVIIMTFWTSVISIPTDIIIESKYKQNFWNRLFESFYSVSLSWFVVQLICLLALKYYEDEECVYYFLAFYFFYILIIFGLYFVVRLVQKMINNYSFNAFDSNLNVKIDFDGLLVEIMLEKETKDIFSLTVDTDKLYLSKIGDVLVAKNADFLEYKNISLELSFNKSNSQYFFMIKDESEKLVDILKSISYFKS